MQGLIKKEEIKMGDWYYQWTPHLHVFPYVLGSSKA